MFIKKGSTGGLNRIYVRNATTLAGLTGAASTLGSNSLISKNCGSNTAVAGTFTELDITNDPGAYYYTPTTGETNTDGDLHITVKGTNAATASIYLGLVVEWDTTDAIIANVTKWNSTTVNTPIIAGNPVVDVNRPTLTVGSGTNGMTTFSITGSFGVNQLKNQWLCWRLGAANYDSGFPQSQQIASNDGAGNVTMSTPWLSNPVAGDVAELIGK